MHPVLSLQSKLFLLENPSSLALAPEGSEDCVWLLMRDNMYPHVCPCL